MSKVLLLSGSARNLFSRFPPTPSVSADAVMPVTNLYDGDPGVPFRFGSNPGDVNLQSDLDLLAGTGRLEVWSGDDPSGVTVIEEGTGTVTKDATNFQEGANAARLTAGDNEAGLRWEKTVAAGWWIQLVFWSKAVTSSPNVRARIQNLHTGNYLTPSLGWAAPDQAALTVTPGGSFGESTLTFQVESFLACLLTDTMPLRIDILNQSGSTAAAVDSVYCIVGVDFASVHGHNLAPLVAAELRSSNDAVTPFSSNDVLEATFTKARPSFYTWLSARVYKRWWRMRLNGVNPSALGAIGMGEAVLGQATELTTHPKFPIGIGIRGPQARTSTPAGSETVFAWGQDELRRPKLLFTYDSLASYQQARDELLRRSRMGAQHVILAPKHDDPEIVVMGRVENAWDALESFLNLRDAEVNVAESAMATIA